MSLFIQPQSKTKTYMELLELKPIEEPSRWDTDNSCYICNVLLERKKEVNVWFSPFWTVT